MRRLKWLFGRTPKDCPLCGEPYYDRPATIYLMAPLSMWEKWGCCHFCGERLASADAELFASTVP